MTSTPIPDHDLDLMDDAILAMEADERDGMGLSASTLSKMTSAATVALAPTLDLKRLQAAIRARLRTEKAEDRGFMSDRHRALIAAQDTAEEALTDSEFEVYEMAVRAGGTIPILDGVLANLGVEL